MITYIYTLSDPTDNIVRYIGKTNNPKRRWYFHSNLKAQKPNRYLNKWLKKIILLGRKPIMNIIDQTDGDWETLEIYWIDKFKKDGFNLVNSTIGGHDSINVLGRAIKQFDLYGNFIKEWKSGDEASLNLNINRGKISLVCNKKRNKAGGFYWEFVDESFIEKNKNLSKKNYSGLPPSNCVGIELYSLNGELLNSFNSMLDASKFYNISVGTIHNNIKGLSKKTKQGIWKIKN